MTAVIRIIEEPEGEAESALLELTEEVITVGRGVENHIRINDAQSSRVHCQIERDGDSYKLVDLESRRGTLVNGRKVNVKILEDGDRIEIGKVAIVFEAEPQETKRQLKPLRRRRSRRRPKVRRTVGKPGGEGAQVLDDKLVGLLEDIGKRLGAEGLAEAETIFQDYLDRADSGKYRKVLEEGQRAAKLVEIAKAVNSERNLKRLLNLIIDEAVRLTDAERGFLVLVQDGAFRFEAARNFDRESVRKPEYKISRSIAEQVAKSGEAMVAADAQTDERFHAYMSVSDLRLRSVICVPLKRKKKVVGVLYMDNRFETGVFTEVDRSTLEAFGDLAAIALENTRLNEENETRTQELASAKDEMEKLNVLLEEQVERQGEELARVKGAGTKKKKKGKKGEKFRYDFSSIIGSSPAMEAVFHLLDRVIESPAPVLIQGESGTGKELVANAIHSQGKRKGKPFVSENCAAIPETLLESELFGYKRGAFTGAFADKKGLFEVANGGTLFLDEIGDMSPGMQKKLLRALQEGEIRVVGGKEIIKVDVRLIAASNKNLRRMVQENAFREDLYYRINVLQVDLPPLRDRREDIPYLVSTFMENIAAKSGGEPKELTREAMTILMNHDWPGNVRELENEVQRSFTISDDEILPSDLSPSVQAGPQKKGAGVKPLKDVVKEAMERVERETILAALQESNWKKSDAAKALGISRPTLDTKIEALEIQLNKK
ncbi:MAG: sigma 54-interacting transcriptional regulator [Planctomycetota bacterium]|jgi:Nif-specific regulatory protein